MIRMNYSSEWVAYKAAWLHLAQPYFRGNRRIICDYSDDSRLFRFKIRAHKLAVASTRTRSIKKPVNRFIQQVELDRIGRQSFKRRVLS